METYGNTQLTLLAVSSVISLSTSLIYGFQTMRYGEIIKYGLTLGACSVASFIGAYLNIKHDERKTGGKESQMLPLYLLTRISVTFPLIFMLGMMIGGFYPSVGLFAKGCMSLLK